MADTVLVLTGIGIPRYSARGLTQTLSPIQQAAQLSRSINGTLEDLSSTQFHLYASKITCTDQRTPAIDGIYPGKTVTVDCVCELALPTGGTKTRTVVGGSARTESGFDFYRPQLTMMVMVVNITVDEYGAAVGWEIDLEEVAPA